MKRKLLSAIMLITVAIYSLLLFSVSSISAQGRIDFETFKKQSRIEEPADNSKALMSLPVKGKSTTSPDGYHAWIIVRPVLGQGYYPQGEIFPSPRDNTWRIQVYLGKRDKGVGEDYQIILALVTERGHQAFMRYLADGPSKGYSAQPLPDGTLLADQITVTRE